MLYQIQISLLTMSDQNAKFVNQIMIDLKYISLCFTDMQAAFDDDWKKGHLSRNGWYKNASDDGIIGYMLMVQTGDSDKPIDKDGVSLIVCDLYD